MPGPSSFSMLHKLRGPRDEATYKLSQEYDMQEKWWSGGCWLEEFKLTKAFS